ncbi:MAG: hypothetical protein SNF68_00095 [Rikenellaceae bacterium]
MIFLFPTEFEATKFRQRHPEAKVIICGVGMAASAATMAQIALNRASEMVILAGIAGSYNLDLHPIDQVVEVTSEQIEELARRWRKVYNIIPRWGLPHATSNTVNLPNFPSKDCGIENMEGAAIAAICEECKIPFSQIRSISNRVGDPSSEWSFESATEALTNVLSIIYQQI